MVIFGGKTKSGEDTFIVDNVKDDKPTPMKERLMYVFIYCIVMAIISVILVRVVGDARLNHILVFEIILIIVINFKIK